MDIDKYKKIESATYFGQKDIVKVGLVLIFFIIASIIAVVNGYPVSSPIVLIFAMFGLPIK